MSREENDPLFSKERVWHGFKWGVRMGALTAGGGLLAGSAIVALDHPDFIRSVVDYPEVWMQSTIEPLVAGILIAGCVSGFIHSFRPTSRLFERSLGQETMETDNNFL